MIILWRRESNYFSLSFIGLCYSVELNAGSAGMKWRGLSETNRNWNMYKRTHYKTALPTAANDVVWTNLEGVTRRYVKTFNWLQSTCKFDPVVKFHRVCKHLILIPLRRMNAENRLIIAGVQVLIAWHCQCAEWLLNHCIKLLIKLLVNLWSEAGIYDGLYR